MEEDYKKFSTEAIMERVKANGLSYGDAEMLLQKEGNIAFFSPRCNEIITFTETNTGPMYYQLTDDAKVFVSLGAKKCGAPYGYLFDNGKIIKGELDYGEDLAFSPFSINLNGYDIIRDARIFLSDDMTAKGLVAMVKEFIYMPFDSDNECQPLYEKLSSQGLSILKDVLGEIICGWGYDWVGHVSCFNQQYRSERRPAVTAILGAKGEKIIRDYNNEVQENMSTLQQGRYAEFKDKATDIIVHSLNFKLIDSGERIIP